MSMEELKLEKTLTTCPDTHISNKIQYNGFYGPLNLFTRNESESILCRLKQSDQPAPLDWKEGNAATNRYYYDIATNSRTINLVTGILGDDVMLWGASILQCTTSQQQPWITDIETSSPNARSVSLIICFGSTDSNMLIKVVSKSHMFGIAIQEMKKKSNNTLEPSNNEVVEWAKKRNKESRIIEVLLEIGELCLLDGRVWHSFQFKNENVDSTALLLQYATPNTAIRIPDVDWRGWPPRFVDVPMPPCIIVHGNARKSQNRIIPPPAALGIHKPRLTTLIRQLNLPLEGDTMSGWRSYRVFHGSSPNLPYFGCYVSVLCPGKTPHSPHAHPEEELLVVIDGSVDLIIADDSKDRAPKIEHIEHGKCVYYPSYQHHTLRNSGRDSATYLMFKWNSRESNTHEILKTNIFSFESCISSKKGNSLEKRLLFEGRTRSLTKLHAHFSTMQPGSSYQPHADSYDVAIIILSGKLETLDHEVLSNSIVLYGAGESHGMRNIGVAPATYLVFEFHT